MGWDEEGKGGVLPQKNKQKSSKNGLNKGKMNESMRERLTRRQCFWVLLILFLINRALRPFFSNNNHYYGQKPNQDAGSTSERR